ncbi:RNA methyltransferase [Marinitoga sp. 1135]|uniref:rRNA methylase, putative, group 3 n=1 Tax=Marinitoga piezophila (strain DSM 14283 / JCM 11233 / KA3) TaxID=443254 RepID=H2J7D0_MARPK|nr:MULTISPECIES: 23S rRNA (guanosine(2251)-2'-O)-methyltransferase RlmB [Marinitoga]AEX85322.1 rRNA methylase, putative, group 3 [Marinitoga piezophila KA3]APT75806.1 RNA methyltransferase [Marinitoga sp. 1137]NUU95543.1 RNA methyltransferase [Marinitoga sp. 1135]NUU97471.1 RNA methyltransferase [Marinitoga sp. 1138]
MYVYGRNVLKEIIKAKYPVKNIFFTDSKKVDKTLNDLINLAEKNKYPYSFAPDKVLQKMSGISKHQGVVIDIGKEFRYADEEILETLREDATIVILDQLQDPHNFGAIIRSSIAADADLIVIPKDNSVEVTPTVIKVSVGLAFRIPILKVTNLSRFIEEIKKQGYWVYGADMSNNVYYKTDLTGKVALVMGNEGSGIREKVKSKCDALISIPMANDVDSLNVSVSAGILLFEIYKQKRGE